MKPVSLSLAVRDGYFESWLLKDDPLVGPQAFNAPHKTDYARKGITFLMAPEDWHHSSEAEQKVKLGQMEKWRIYERQTQDFAQLRLSITRFLPASLELYPLWRDLFTPLRLLWSCDALIKSELSSYSSRKGEVQHTPCLSHPESVFSLSAGPVKNRDEQTGLLCIIERSPSPPFMGRSLSHVIPRVLLCQEHQTMHSARSVNPLLFASQICHAIRGRYGQQEGDPSD